MKPSAQAPSSIASSASSSRVMPQILTPRARRTSKLALSRPSSSRQAASMSGARISVSPISTASTPTRSSSSSCSRVEKPDSDTTVLPAGTSASSVVGALDVDAEVRQVAVVDPEHVGLDLERGLELALVVDLDERVEVERARLVQQALELVQLERGDDQQDRVGAGRGGLVELVGVDDEVLAQDGQRRRRRAPRAGRRASRAKWNGSVRMRQRGGAAALVGAHDLGDLGALADRPGRRRAPLVLGDQRDAGPRERLARTAGSPRRGARACDSSSASGIDLRRRLTSSRVSSTIRSSTLMRAPAPA